MNIRKSDKYKNYGQIPRNEYTAAGTKNNTNSIDTTEHDTQADDTMHVKRSRKPPVKYPTLSGWKCSGKANGWRAELASRREESMAVRRYYNYVIDEKAIF